MNPLVSILAILVIALFVLNAFRGMPVVQGICTAILGFALWFEVNRLRRGPLA